MDDIDDYYPRKQREREKLAAMGFVFNLCLIIIALILAAGKAWL